MRAPRRLLLNDEGSSALHYLDLEAPAKGWSVAGPGRDLQLIGGGRVLRSTPQGYTELALSNGECLKEMRALDGVESARRLPNGHTVCLANGADGILVVELNERDELVRRLLGPGLAKGRLLRRTEQDMFLFCSDSAGNRLLHEASFATGMSTLFQVPLDVPADSMLKVARVAPQRVLVSSGYAASLLLIDTAQGRVLSTLGGKDMEAPAGLRRALSPHFFSGFQLLADGSCLVANWQGHGPTHGADGYQLPLFDAQGALVWTFDQTEFPQLTSLNNVLMLDDLDTAKLHDELCGALKPVG